jgi:hypothetical protein
MAFAFAKKFETVMGSKRVVVGTYTSTAAGTGGDIRTGLGKVDSFHIQQKGAAVVATAAVVNEDLPLADPITIVTVANGVGYWKAIGS